MSIPTKYWIFHQNNSGGRYDYDEKHGISSYLAIEATSEKKAQALFNAIVEEYGPSYSCECCGDRWSDYAYESYDLIEGVIMSAQEHSGWDSLGPNRNGNARFRYFIHHLDGRIEGYGLTRE